MYSELEVEGTLEEQTIWDIRDTFQRTLTDGTWCCDEQEAKDFLAKSNGDLGVVLRALASLVTTLRQKHQLPSQFMPDELIMHLEESITSELLRKTQQTVDREHKSSVVRVKSLRARFGVGKVSSCIPGLCEAFQSRIKLHSLEPEEAQELLSSAKGSIGIVLQSFNSISWWVRKCTNPPTRETVMEHIHSTVLYELEKFEKRKAQV